MWDKYKYTEFFEQCSQVFPAGINLFKVNDGNTRTMCEICQKGRFGCRYC